MPASLAGAGEGGLMTSFYCLLPRSKRQEPPVKWPVEYVVSLSLSFRGSPGFRSHQRKKRRQVAQQAPGAKGMPASFFGRTLPPKGEWKLPFSSLLAVSSQPSVTAVPATTQKESRPRQTEVSASSSHLPPVPCSLSQLPDQVWVEDRLESAEIPAPHSEASSPPERTL